MGHVTRVCRHMKKDDGVVGEASAHLGDDLANRGLDAEFDLRGNSLRMGSRGGGSSRSNGGRYNLEGARNERINERGGLRRTARSPTISGMGGQGLSGEGATQHGADCFALVREGVEVRDDMKHGHRGISLGEEIRRQREEDEKARKVWEKAYDVGLIGPRKVITDGAVNVVLKTMPKEDKRVNMVCVLQETGREIDLNVEVQLREGINFRGVKEGIDNDGVGGVMGWGGGVREDDPFELDPIIEAVMKQQKMRKRTIQEVEYVEQVECMEPQSSRPRKLVFYEAEETSLKGSPKSP